MSIDRAKFAPTVEIAGQGGPFGTWFKLTDLKLPSYRLRAGTVIEPIHIVGTGPDRVRVCDDQTAVSAEGPFFDALINYRTRLIHTLQTDPQTLPEIEKIPRLG